MVNKGQQLRMKRIVERLLTESCNMPVYGLEKEILRLGFVQTGGDQRALQFENLMFELFLDIILAEERCVRSYRIVPLSEKNNRQQNFRW